MEAVATEAKGTFLSIHTKPKLEVKPKWVEQLFWTPKDVAEFLETLTPEQASAAKVIHWEVKIMVLYPNA